MKTQTLKELITRAHRVMTNAYAPYSKFRVGAAVLADNGEIYTGCNVENASYGLTLCAERAAIVKAVSEGARRMEAIAISAVEAARPSPCGACRQVMAEFMPPDAPVIIVNEDGLLEQFTLDELLPHRFELPS